MNKKVLTLCAAMLLSGSSLVPLYADNSFEPTSFSLGWKMDFDDFVKYYSAVSYNKATKTLTVNDEVTYSDLHKFLLIDEDNVVLDGQGKTWNGRIVVTGENVTIKNLIIDYKNAFVPTEDATVIENKSAITVFASNVTIDGCKIKCSVEHPNNYMANGIVLYPLTQKPIFKITNTTISGANSIVAGGNGFPDAPSFGIQILGNLKDETSNGFTYFQSDKFTNSASNLDLSNCVFPESDAYVNCATDFGYIEVTGMVPGETKDAESYKIVSVQKNSNNELAVKKAITNAVDNAIVEYSGTSDDLMSIMKNVPVTNNVAVQCGGDQVNVLYSNAAAPDNNWESISVSSDGKTVASVEWGHVPYEKADGKSLKVVLVHRGAAVKTIQQEDGSVVYTLGEYKPSSTNDVNLPAQYHFTLTPRMNDAGNYELRLVDCYGNDFRVNGHVVTVSNVTIDKNDKGKLTYNNKTIDQAPIPTELELKAGSEFVSFDNASSTFKTYDNASDAQKFGTAKISIANIYAENLLKRHGDHFTLKITYNDKYQNDIDVTGAFAGNLRPCYVSYNAGKATYTNYTGKETSYMLANEKGEIIALDKDAALLEGKEGFGYVLKAISPKDFYLDTDRYLVWFDMEYTPGQDVNSFTTITKISLVGYTVGLQKNSEGEIVLVAANEANLLASPTISIKLNEGSVVNAAAWLNKIAYYTVKSINKEGYGNNAGKVLGLTEYGYGVNFVDEENIDLTQPEGQFAIRYENGKYNFINRERNQAVSYELDADKLYQIDATTFAYVNGTTTPDTLSINPITTFSSEDGFKRFSPAELNANTYTVSMKLVNGDLLNIIEKHNDKHRLGLDEDNATEWRIEMPTVKLLDNTGDFLRYAADTVSSETAIQFFADGYWQWTQIDDPKAKYYSAGTELQICTYILKNADNGEYLYGKNSSESVGNSYYVCEPENKDKVQFATRIAFKENGEGTYNLVPVSTWESGSFAYESYNFDGQLSGNKIQGGASGDVLKDTELYEATANDLFVINVAEAPTYKKMEQGDKIILSLKNNTENVLVEGPVDGFATISNREAHKDLNPTLYVDTAYVNRAGNYAYQYLLGVRINRVDTTYKCTEPSHGTHRADTTFGYFLVNMIDSAKACTDVHNNKFVYNEDYKLDFVKGYHTNDTLFFTNDADEVISSMKIGDASYNMAKFAFKMIDEEANEFVIETGKGYDKQTVKKGSTWATVTNEVTTPSYLRWVNGNLVVTGNIDDAAHFTMETSDKEATANEAISAGNVVVAGTNGAVVVKGAEGKNVIVSTILGKVVANEVVSSDNAQITAPAGIVVVSVDGESFKVVVK